MRAMQVRAFWVGLLSLAMLCGACSRYEGPSTSTVLRGKVTQGGQPLSVDTSKYSDYAHVEVRLVPTEGNPNPGLTARAKPDGSFELNAYEDQPAPTGKYRIAVFQWNPAPEKDDLQGQFDEKNTPIVREIAPGQTELLIDLDKPEG